MQTPELAVSLSEDIAGEDEREHCVYQKEVEAIRLGIAECEQGKALPARVALEDLRERHAIRYGR